MLVGYSSSSEEESEVVSTTVGNEACSPNCKEDTNDGGPARKKPKAEERVPKTRSAYLVAFIRLAA